LGIGNGYYPLASMLNGPVVNEVTVLVVVAAMLLNVSLANTFNAVTPYCLMQRLPMDHFTASIDVYHNQL
jgi:hypothetical protein